MDNDYMKGINNYHTTLRVKIPRVQVVKESHSFRRKLLSVVS